MYQAVKDYFRRPDVAAEEWHKQNVLTPDIWKLEQSKYQLLFVPDDMMEEGNNNHLISDAVYEGGPVHPACFTLEKFTFWKKDLGVESFPIPMDKTYTPSNWLRVPPTPAKIKGELYAILSQRIKVLDIRRQNGLQFRRVRNSISLPYRHVKFLKKSSNFPEISHDYLHTVEAWMYVGIPEYWDNQIGDMYQLSEVPQFEFDQPKFWCERFYKFE